MERMIVEGMRMNRKIDKKRLYRYRELKCEIVDEIERLNLKKEEMSKIPSPKISDMPRSQRKFDKLSLVIDEKNQIEKHLETLAVKEQKERKIITAKLSELTDAQHKRIIRLYFFDLYEWPEVNKIMFGHEADFSIQENTKYIHKTYKICAAAIRNLK